MPLTVTRKDLICVKLEMAIRNVFRDEQLAVIGQLTDSTREEVAKAIDELKDIKGDLEPKLRAVLHA